VMFCVTTSLRIDLIPVEGVRPSTDCAGTRD
jgi:hypothetical protein